MEILNLKLYGVEAISDIEAKEIDGGHEGLAYQIGQGLGKVVVFTVTVAAFVVYFFAPKS
jgi:hypothetical protein